MSFILTQQYPYYGFVQLSSVFQLLLCGAQGQSILKFKIFYFVYPKYHSHHFLCCSLTLPNDYWLIPSSVWSVCGMMILQKSKAVHERFAFFKYIYITWKKVRLFINIQNQIKNFYFILNQNVVLVAVMLHMATLAVCSRFFLFCWYPTV